MTSRSTPAFVCLLLVAGCSPPLGRVLVSVVFENETRTQCIRASARNASGSSVNASPAALPRAGKDTLKIGLGETAELVGEVQVTVNRFTSADCSGAAFASETKPADVVRGAPTVLLEFRYTGTAGNDGGTDGGADGGTDGGCNLTSCANTPGECEVGPAIGCQGDGGCLFSYLAPRTVCATGVCNSMGRCITNECAVFDAGASCDDELPCTSNTICAGGDCVGTCPPPPDCHLNAPQLMCDLNNPTACAIYPALDLSACGPPADGTRCLDGGCVPWLQLSPLNFPTTLADLPYPTGSWVLASPDGGVCDTVVNTTGPMATVMQGECGSPTITSTVNDAGVAVITTRGLDVGPNARLHFVGSRPVQLVVIGDANIRGVVSVAPILGGQQPAGTDPAACMDAIAGLASKEGGGGGGFGGNGGRGGESGGAGGGAAPLQASLIPLRGGCPGAPGFRAAGNSPAGTGGGALQLIVANSITMNGGTVTASGGGGTQGTADNEGAGGGGSGGTVIIEARIIDLTGGAVTANGGGGGEGGDTGRTSEPGALGPIRLAAAAPAANGASTGGIGGIGGDANALSGGTGGSVGGAEGGGGGGGSVGVIYIGASVSCTRGTGIVSGSQPMSAPISCN